jgi:DNA-binding response OmpR family regulator
MGQPLEKKTIVVVEDNEAIAQLMTDILGMEPEYEAVVVHDGSLAVETVRSVKASLVLLDLGLPEANGLQIYDILRSEEDTRDIPIIFMTSMPRYDEFRKRNISQFIQKPFDLDVVLTNVAIALNGTKEQREGPTN